MKKICCGISGTDVMPMTHKLSELPCDAKLIKAFQKIYGGDVRLRPAQDEAFFKAKLLTSKKNAIVTTPTNSGKSMISYLLLFRHAAKGHRVVLLEPLRALAQEKGLELTRLAEAYKAAGGDKVRVVITTGDYRTSDDFLNSKPQAYSGGQIIVATPERLDAITREPKNSGWLRKIVFVCLDEAHLIGDSSRGATIELLLTFLRILEYPPRIVLMSATISNADELAQWLQPCDVMNSVVRYPKLQKFVCQIEEGEDATEKVFLELDEILKADDTSAVVFVYTTAMAEKAARDYIKHRTGRLVRAHDLSAAVQEGVAWFHAQLKASTKLHIVDLVSSGKVRVAFTTTALGMGVNLPATHVIVRDVSFAGDGRELDVSDFLQMLGRAGRGDRNGTGIVFVKDSATAKRIVSGLRAEVVPKVVSRLAPPEVDDGYFGKPKRDDFREDRIGAQILGALYRHGSSTLEDLEGYFAKSFGGREFNGIREILEKYQACDGTDWNLVSFDENTNEYKPTTLGAKTTAGYLSPRTAARVGALVRALLADDLFNGKDIGTHLRLMTGLDWLIVVCVASPDVKNVVRWNEKLPQKLNSEIEALRGEKSHLYNAWIKAEPELLYQTICFDDDHSDEKAARKKMIQAALNAVLVYRVSQGDDLDRIGEAYNVDFAEVNEKLRDACIWQLAGIDGIMDSHSFYYTVSQLIDENGRQDDREALLKPYNVAFSGAKPGTRGCPEGVESISSKLFGVIADLKFRSKLGKMIRSIKLMFPKAKRHPGEGAISKLEKGGILAIRDLIGKNASDLTALGVELDYAQMIVSYIKNRLR